MPARRFHRPAVTRATLVAVTLLVVACSTTTSPSATPASVATTGPASPLRSPGPASAASPAASAAPVAPTLPPGVLQLPTEFAAELPPGRYQSSPPFQVAFTFEVLEPGWVAGHRGPEFVDMQRFVVEPAPGVVPVRLIGFGHAETFRGDDGDVAVSELTPGEAVDLLAERASLGATNVGEIELFGRPGARVDLHSDVANNPVFGGADGTFGLGPELDMRLVVVPLEDDVLLVVVMAPAGELEAAWDEALPVLRTVELAS